MNNTLFTSDDFIFFYDTLTFGNPYISEKPRNHESICFVTKGNLLYEKGKEKTVIKTGRTAYIAKGSVDKSSAFDCDEVSYIAVNFNFEKNPSLSRKHLPFDTLCLNVDFYRSEELFKQALYYQNSCEEGSHLICKGILCQLIGLMYNNRAISGANESKYKKIKNSLDYMNEHFFESDFKISDLSRISNISEKHFRSLFFELYNKKPYEFLINLRLNKAKALLLNNSKRISDVAVECGFSDLYSFSHCFKKYYGTSPKQYKKMLDSGDAHI